MDKGDAMNEEGIEKNAQLYREGYAGGDECSSGPEGAKIVWFTDSDGNDGISFRCNVGKERYRLGIIFPHEEEPRSTTARLLGKQLQAFGKSIVDFSELHGESK